MPNTANPIPENRPNPGSKPFPANKPDIPNVDVSNKPGSDSEEEKRMQRLADEAARKAGKTEQKYDQAHTTISK
ncbi:MAG: hypothetical protein WAM85_15915 [Terracidiphilus sp.]